MQKSETVSNKEISNKEISNESVLNKTMSNEADYTEQIKSYLKRLGAGESLKSVRADFVKEFREVDSSEIMKAEQELLKEGTPLTEVQKLCDVHATGTVSWNDKRRKCSRKKFSGKKFRI